VSDQLHVLTADGQELPETLRVFGTTLSPEGAVLLAYSPRRCFFARLGPDGTATGAAGAPIDLREVYEVRAFHSEAELRWRNDPGRSRRHQTVILADRELGLALSPRPQPGVRGRLRQTYLLWGGGDDSAGLGAGWSRLSNRRIGSLDVPLGGVRPGQRVLLQAVEYLTEGEHGNVSVLDERLVGLEVAGG
jgi:CRISPR-associated protein (TIGR03984 family)